MDVKAPLGHGFDHARVEHQVPPVACGHEDALGAVQADALAASEKTLDLFVDATHRPHVTVGIERTRDGQALRQRHARQRGQQGIQLGAGRRIALDPAVLLLEDQAGFQRQRGLVCKQRHQITLQDEHALVMHRTGQIHLAVDAQQALLARAGPRGHPHRKTEAVVPQHHHAQAVDAGLHAAAQGQHALALHQGVEQALLGLVVALGARLAGSQHVPALHQVGLPCTGLRGALHHQRFRRRKHRALAELILGQPVAVLDQQRNRLRREMRQAPARTGAGHKNRGVVPGLWPGHEAVGKVHLAAKAPGQLGVQRLHRFALLGRGQQHQLDLGLHRLGREGHRGHRRIEHPRLVDLQTPAAHKAAQALPDRCIGQHIAQVQHQKAPVRAQQAARADAGEVGHQHLAIGFVFDATKQLAVGGVVLLQHRGALQPVVVHRHIHAQAGQQILQGLEPQILVLGVAHKELHMLEHLGLQGLQPGFQHGRLRGRRMHRLANLLPGALEQGPHHLSAQRGQAFVAHMFERPRLVQKAGDLLAQPGFGLVDAKACLRAQRHGFPGGQRFTLLVLATEDQMALLAHQAEMPRLRKGVEVGISP